jgi:hypothetical protein
MDKARVASGYRAAVRRLLPAFLVALVLSPPAAAGGPGLLVGAAEDQVKQGSLVATKAKLELLRLAGFRAVRVTSIWAPGLRQPTADEQRALANLATAAQLVGMRVFVSVMNFGSRTTPLDEADQADFAAYAAALARDNPSLRDIVVGNEPNLNRFWMPQFTPEGASAAPAAYLSLLAKTYDALKAVSPDITVIGGALAPRGSDRPGGLRPTHSPTAFIRALGAAYRASGRTRPIMDALAIHVYQDTSSTPPSFTHPRSTTIAIADYDKLVALLGEAFDGTAQPGSTLPIVYGEFGAETVIPAEKASLYHGREPTTVKPVDERTQGAYYREAVALAFCQPTVRALFIFHAIDEDDLDRWQSGVYYADGTAKESMPAMAQAARDARGGVIARCPGLRLTPRAKVTFPRGPALRAVPLRVGITCDIDCNYRLRLERLPQGSTTLAVSGRARAETPTVISLPPRRLARGRYRLVLRLTAPLNTGPPASLRSAPFLLP